MRPVPLTWAVDPALLDAVTALAAVPAPTPSQPDPSTLTAGDFLARLTAATTGRPTLGLPYADVDTVALHRDGLDAQVRAAVATGADVLAATLPGATTLQGVAWPVGGAVTEGALTLLESTGTRSLLLADAALPPDESLTFSPGAKAVLAGVTAAVSDSALDALVARESGTTDATAGETPPGPTLTSTIAAEQASPRLAEQRFLVETALIAAERAVRRDFVVTPPRRWDPDPAYAAAVLGAPGRVPWLVPVTLDQVLGAQAPETQRADLVYPDAAAAAELPPSYLDSIAPLAQRLSTLATVLTDPALLEPARRSLLAAQSSAWRDGLAGGRAALRDVGSRADDIAGAIRITTVGRVTLTSDSGQIPVTISNDLPQAVRVRLTVAARQAARLESVDAGQTVTIAAGARQTFSVGVTARTTGTFPVEVRLLTPDARPLGPVTELLLTSTAYGRTALGVALAAAAVLLVGVGVRLTRRALRARREPAP